jgi:hypothetical protein
MAIYRVMAEDLPVSEFPGGRDSRLVNADSKKEAIRLAREAIGPAAEQARMTAVLIP